MGVETAALVGFSAISAAARFQQQRSEAEALTDQADLEAANLAKQTRQRAASAKVSFLNSGLALEGSPINAIEGIFDAGIADVDQIRINANKRSKNIMSAARTEAILGLAQSGATAFSGGFGGGGGFGPGFNTFMSPNTLSNSGTFRTLSTGRTGFIGPLPK